jgi:hypothetical protein
VRRVYFIILILNTSRTLLGISSCSRRELYIRVCIVSLRSVEVKLVDVFQILPSEI